MSSRSYANSGATKFCNFLALILMLTVLGLSAYLVHVSASSPADRKALKQVKYVNLSAYNSIITFSNLNIATLSFSCLSVVLGTCNFFVLSRKFYAVTFLSSLTTAALAIASFAYADEKSYKYYAHPSSFHSYGTGIACLTLACFATVLYIISTVTVGKVKVQQSSFKEDA